jgi:urease gamma subunit
MLGLALALMFGLSSAAQAANAKPFISTRATSVERRPTGWRTWARRPAAGRGPRCRHSRARLSSTADAMRLTPTELDRLTIFTAAELARRRRAKGWKLTHPEALALICDEMHEAARGGASYEEVARVGASTLTEDDVLDGVGALVGTIRIECLFGDGMRVLHVERPIGPGRRRAP